MGRATNLHWLFPAILLCCVGQSTVIRAADEAASSEDTSSAAAAEATSATKAPGSDKGITAAELEKVRAAEAARIAAIEKVYGSVVAIYGNNRQGGGSGVIFDPEGYALTNFHVVNAAGTEGWAGLADGILYRWRLIGMDPGGDVAIIKLESKDKDHRKPFPYAKLGDSDTVRQTDWAMAMGNPFVLAEDQRPTVTLGIVSGPKRYQAGAGKNMLVYGNCIQVDSSINPGNSGGPLFNLRGEVIGINGRGSFKERGRVNVGVGYAISVNQIKMFIADLLATKVAQHGTLDATFSNRTDGVLCYQLNLDSQIAKLGLDIGDRLVAFDGLPITNANQFTNRLATLPAGWPVQLVWERDGQTRSAWVRLDALPYGQPRQAPMRRPMPKPDEPKDPDQPKDGDKPDQPEPIEVKISLDNPGVVRDAAENKRQVQRILAAWRQFATAGSSGKFAALRIEEDLFQAGRKVGSQSIVMTPTGTFRIEQPASVFAGEKPRTIVWNGSSGWRQTGDQAREELSAADLVEVFDYGLIAAIGPLLGEEAIDHFATLELEGSDRTQNRNAYRLRAQDHRGNKLYFWFSLYDDAGQPEVRLLKTSRGIDGDARDLGQTYVGYRQQGPLRLPGGRLGVSGLIENPTIEYVTTSCEVLEQVPAELKAPVEKEDASEKKERLEKGPDKKEGPDSKEGPDRKENTDPKPGAEKKPEVEPTKENADAAK